MRARIIKKCLSCGFVRLAEYKGTGCDGCGSAKDLEWWVSTGIGDSEGCKLIPQLEGFLAKQQYEDICATLGPVEHILAGSEKLLSILLSARTLYAADLSKQAQECLERGEIERSLERCRKLQREFPAQSEVCKSLLHDICDAFVARGEAAISTDDWQNALTFAQKGLELEPGNSDAVRLCADVQAKIHLKDLAARAFAAYKSRDLSGCRNACEAFLSYQRECGVHVEFTDSSNSVIDFGKLPGKLKQDIIGNPKNKKSLVQEILSVVMWGYIGKKFFDFIGVTKPISLPSIFPGTRSP